MDNPKTGSNLGQGFEKNIRGWVRVNIFNLLVFCSGLLLMNFLVKIGLFLRPNLGLKLGDFSIFWVFFHSFCQKLTQKSTFLKIFPNAAQRPIWVGPWFIIWIILNFNLKFGLLGLGLSLGSVFDWHINLYWMVWVLGFKKN